MSLRLNLMLGRIWMILGACVRQKKTIGDVCVFFLNNFRVFFEFLKKIKLRKTRIFAFLGKQDFPARLLVSGDRKKFLNFFRDFFGYRDGA